MPLTTTTTTNLVLFSFVYGENMYRDPVLQLFLKAVKGCGVDVVMLSTLNASARDGVDSTLFGSNVRERRIEWQTLASMLQRKFASSETSAIAFATAHPFKAHERGHCCRLLFRIWFEATSGGAGSIGTPGSAICGVLGPFSAAIAAMCGRPAWACGRPGCPTAAALGAPLSSIRRRLAQWPAPTIAHKRSHGAR